MQTIDQNVLEHGLSVLANTKKLIAGEWDGMKIPEWFSKNHVFIVNNLHTPDIIKQYNVYHDCGKPYCLTIDEEGKRHFPDHAAISANIYLQYFPEDTITAKLIADDMCLHVETSEQIAIKDWTIKDAFTLLITALAELHSNAAMFGGIESVSFKIKYKKIDKRGAQLVKKFLKDVPHTYSYVITRNDLPNGAKTVQSVHAAIESFVGGQYEHSSIICLVVKSESKLKKVILELFDADISFKIFREPDMDNQITAICTEPLEGERRKILQRFQLLK